MGDINVKRDNGNQDTSKHLTESSTVDGQLNIKRQEPIRGTRVQAPRFRQREYSFDEDTSKESFGKLQNPEKKNALVESDESEYSDSDQSVRPRPFSNKKNVESDEYSEYSDEEEGENGMTWEQIQSEKIKYLSRLDRLEKRGVHLDRRFTMKSDLLEVKEYYERITHGKHVENGVKMCEKVLRTCVAGIEFLNKMYDPFDFDLDGWSEEVDDDINDGSYGDVFEELYEKYSGKSSMSPEIKVLLMIVGGATAFHMKKKMTKKLFGGNRGGNNTSAPAVNPHMMSNILNMGQQQKPDMPVPQQDVNELVRKMKEDLSDTDSDKESKGSESDNNIKTINVTARGRKPAQKKININI